MFAKIRRLLSQFFSKSGTIDNEPLNKVSLIVIILIDIFILLNVFTGLDDISRWHIRPSQTYPCYSEWANYRSQTTKDKDYDALRLALPYNTGKPSFRHLYEQVEAGHLGNVSESCLQYADAKDRVNIPRNQQALRTIDRKQSEINSFEQKNQTIRTQYDSTLLEKIAGQPREQSINEVGAEKAKQELDENNRKISTLRKEVTNLKRESIAQPESVVFIGLLKDAEKFGDVEKGYQQASFWYPSIQLAFQVLFLIPLIFVAASAHNFAQRKGFGLISLISWHLLVIFFIPLILKIFEFLQIGAIFQFVFRIVRILFGGLLFAISYVYILLIPLVGFGIIKFFQKFAFNAKVQAAKRVQKSLCIKCARRLHPHDSYCPHCGYYQYVECSNCHDLTYKSLPYCKQCGHAQNL
jgi:predicted RNA-binding Zn-ribbon protein involved in translation (DUF1610 family)